MTVPLYLNSNEMLTCTATITKAVNNVIVLNQTVFYPKGGGQPSDVGVIRLPGTELKVEKVLRGKEGIGEIEHYVVGDLGTATPGTEVTCCVDSDTRHLHSRYHLAGHLIRIAFITLGISHEWKTGVTSHLPGAAYVEFNQRSGNQEVIDISSIEQECVWLIDKKLKSWTVDNVKMDDIPEKAKWMVRCEDCNSLRIHRVEGIDDYWMPCGGTLCDNLGEIGKFKITKHSFKKGLLRICYQFD